MTVAKEVVQFLMGIFGDRQAARDFLDDPEGVLESHGLAGVSSADVDAAMPVVLDYAPVNVTASNVDPDFNAATGTGHAGGGWSPLPAGGGNDDHGQAVEQLTNVVANYSYPSTADDRGALTDHSPALNIWADGDVEQWFDNDSAPAFGDPAMGAGNGMGFADIRIDGFFDLDADSDTETANAGQGFHPATSVGESFPEAQPPYADIDAAGDGLEFTEDDPASIDIDHDIDDAGAGEAADSMDFGA